MRYRAGEDPATASLISTDYMMILTALLSIAIGAVLVWMGVHGRQMWLRWWGGGLVVASVATLVWTALGDVKGISDRLPHRFTTTRDPA